MGLSHLWRAELARPVHPPPIPVLAAILAGELGMLQCHLLQGAVSWRRPMIVRELEAEALRILDAARGAG